MLLVCLCCSTFKQQRELMALQIEHEKLKLLAEVEEKECKVDKELALEKMCNTEKEIVFLQVTISGG